MQKSNAYWRASHPLVFISCLLLAGVGIANILPNFFLLSSDLFFLLIIFIEIGLLILSFRYGENKLYKGLLTMACIISWGAIIQWNTKLIFQFQLPSFINNLIIDIRNWMILKIDRNITSKEANSFAIALLIGVKMDMNKSLLNAYTQLGIIHIIAISGMHLDILFKALTKVTYHFPNNAVFKCMELMLLFTLVWIYCFIANASPSIVRASIFFSIFLIGNFFAKSNFTLNSIAAGIMLLLLINVHGIYNIGLQLSYSAVIGIHLFYKLLYNAIEIDNPIIRFLWSNCCVSIAAQITTLPILLLHFHQVASWVLISNFIMVPLSNLMLYGLVLFMLLPQGLAVYFGSLISKYILLFNGIVRDWFMYTKAETIYIKMNGLQVFGYYLILVFMYLWIYQKKSSYLIVILGLITVYVMLKLFSFMNFMWKM